MKELRKKLFQLKSMSSARKFIALVLVLLINIYSNPALASRFDPPSIKTHIENFDMRIHSDIFNVDFLVAHVINNGRKVVREVEEQTDETVETLQNTSIFTNNTESGDTAAGSVVIPPGTTAGTIIVINVNEGDSIAISR